MPEGPPRYLAEPSPPVHPGGGPRATVGHKDPGIAQVDVAGAVLAGEQAAVAVGKTSDGIPCRTMLVTLAHQGLADAPEQPCPATGLVVDRPAAVHRERGPGRMLDLVEPLSIRDDR
jgi:hypothetical protein